MSHVLQEYARIDVTSETFSAASNLSERTKGKKERGIDEVTRRHPSRASASVTLPSAEQKKEAKGGSSNFDREPCIADGDGRSELFHQLLLEP